MGALCVSGVTWNDVSGCTVVLVAAAAELCVSGDAARPRFHIFLSVDRKASYCSKVLPLMLMCCGTCTTCTGKAQDCS